MAIRFNKIGVIGAGAWGTALANMFRCIGREVLIWAHEPKVVEAINKTHENDLFLRGVKLEQSLLATNEWAPFADHDAIFLCNPAQHMEAIAKNLAPIMRRTVPLVICCKGIDSKTGALMSEMVSEFVSGATVAVLSGPTFATEVARAMPTAVTIASKDEKIAADLAESIGNMRFRPYTSTDIIGVQVGGALKNVFAIASGMIMGKGLGENARAALVTRGLSEMTRLAVAMGGKAETLRGLAGLGDLMLTCGSPQSRNMSLGMALGRGDALDKVMGHRQTVAEGVATAKSALIRAAKHNVELPLIEGICNILHNGADIMKTMEALLSRPFHAED
jgi:glycerol-3-phosphate dehydrogenase (NAD(P)+)